MATSAKHPAAAVRTPMAGGPNVRRKQERQMIGCGDEYIDSTRQVR